MIEQFNLVKLKTNLVTDEKEDLYKIQSCLFERSNLIIKILKLCIEKLKSLNENSLAKGLNWILKEIQDSLIFKSDDNAFRLLEHQKENNQDLQTIFLWLEQYSSLKDQNRERIGKVKHKTQSFTCKLSLN